MFSQEKNLPDLYKGQIEASGKFYVDNLVKNKVDFQSQYIS